MSMSAPARPDFEALAAARRTHLPSERRLVGHVPTIALAPVADGRTGAYETNVEKTWRMTAKVYDLIANNVRLPDGTPVRVVVAPEIVYGPRSGAVAQKHFAEQGVSACIFLSRSWAYSDELMSACQGIGSSEWQLCAYGLNQTDRPGAVWLKAFTAAMDEKGRPIFCIYSPDLESEDGPLSPFVAERLLRFARCAAAVAEMRGKNYLSIGSVSMGIIGSDVRRNSLLHYFGMGTVSYDMVGLQGRMARGFYDHEELARAVKFMKRFQKDFGKGRRPWKRTELVEKCLQMALITRDLMVGNPRLADPAVGKAQGFKADVEYAQGTNAIAAGTQGQRQWTDLYPNFDVTESLLNSSFGWEDFRTPYIVATENDAKNGMGMLVAHLVTGGVPQLFADIRTNWTPASIKAATGTDVADLCPRGIIDKRNSGAGALDYALDIFRLVPAGDRLTIAEVWNEIRGNTGLQEELMRRAIEGTTYMHAALEYFPGDGLSSHYRTPGGVPMTAYRYNMVGEQLTCSVVEGETVELPRNVADHISQVTDKTWPETYWTPRDMTSFDYMSRIGPNHDANSFGLIGADLVTLNAMLRIPVDMHNVPKDQLFRPTLWDRFGGDDFRACAKLGPLYA
ncbi:MAG TPA: L-fucose isomerase [Planctomycetota bacterium]|nr:L-fucose isomerase [Planctomycetota bacterium]